MVEVLFRLINEPGKIDEFEDIYQKITKLSCPFSFVIVNQVCVAKAIMMYLE